MKTVVIALALALLVMSPSLSAARGGGGGMGAGGHGGMGAGGLVGFPVVIHGGVHGFGLPVSSEAPTWRRAELIMHMTAQRYTTPGTSVL